MAKTHPDWWKSAEHTQAWCPGVSPQISSTLHTSVSLQQPQKSRFYSVYGQNPPSYAH
jgi:hypothetical protein